jgi:hypothetical protein
MIREKSITSFLDKKIDEQFKEGFDISIAIKFLKEKSTNIIQTHVKNESIKENISNISNKEMDSLDAKTRYAIIYAKHCYKRIEDLLWLRNNKYKFNVLSNEKIFMYIKFKDRLNDKANVKISEVVSL